MQSSLAHWFIGVIILIIVFGTIFAAVQQSIRLLVTEPQIQTAADTVSAITKGAEPKSMLLPSSTIDISQSLAPYVIIYDADGKPIISSAMLNGKIPVPPPGVFAYTAAHDEDRLTWQPAPGVRQVAVVRHFGGSHAGFVLAGRSLTEVEKLESRIELIVFLGWLTAVCLFSIRKFFAPKP